MNDKLIYYQNLAAKTVNEIYSGSDYWMTFLNTASKIYKYSFVDQILIHAQMPEATACAEYRIWNDTMHRYIKKGSRGIALLTETDAGIGLRYVYDISCTGTRRNSRNVDAFVYREEHESAVFSVLPDGNSLEERLFPAQNTFYLKIIMKIFHSRQICLKSQMKLGIIEAQKKPC